jgi:hypothetical protein
MGRLLEKRRLSDAKRLRSRVAAPSSHVSRCAVVIGCSRQLSKQLSAAEARLRTPMLPTSGRFACSSRGLWSRLPSAPTRPARLSPPEGSAKAPQIAAFLSKDLLRTFLRSRRRDEVRSSGDPRPWRKEEETQSGGMFWLSRKRLSESYLRLSAFRRSYLAAP